MNSQLEQLNLQRCWSEIGVWGSITCPELSRFLHCRHCPVYARAADRMLNRGVPESYLDEWTRHYAGDRTAIQPYSDSAMVFRIGSEWLALQSRFFEEVADERPVHSLPGDRGNAILGVANIRGELVVCVSLAAILGIETGSSVPAVPRFLVAKSSTGRIVFPADEVHGIHRFTEQELKPAPATVSKSPATYTEQVIGWNDRAVGYLHASLLFATIDRSLA